MDAYTFCNWVLMVGATAGMLFTAAIGWSFLFCYVMRKIGDMFGDES